MRCHRPGTSGTAYPDASILMCGHSAGSRRARARPLRRRAAALGRHAPDPQPDRAPAAAPPAEGARTQLILLGTSGGPPEWPGSTRAGIASAVLVGDRYYIVDAGAGVVRQARDAQLGNWQHDTEGPLDALRAVFLTHLHSDHVVDLNNIMTVGLFNGLSRVEQKVPIWGPGNRGALPPLFGPPPAAGTGRPGQPDPGHPGDGGPARAGLRHRLQRPRLRQPQAGAQPAVRGARRAHPGPVPGRPEREPAPADVPGAVLRGRPGTRLGRPS